MTKGDLMKLVFTKEELQNIDVAIPQELLGVEVEHKHLQFYVFDYNDSVLGRLVDMRKLAVERGIDIETGARLQKVA